MPFAWTYLLAAKFLGKNSGKYYLISEISSEFITQDSKPVFCAFSKMFHSRGPEALAVAYKELETQKIR